MDRRATFNLTDQAIDQITILQNYYKAAHGLDLSASAVVRRAICGLTHELGLAEEPSAEQIHWALGQLATMERGEKLDGFALNRLVEFTNRYCGPGDPTLLGKIQSRFREVMEARDGQAPK